MAETQKIVPINGANVLLSEIPTTDPTLGGAKADAEGITLRDAQTGTALNIAAPGTNPGSAIGASAAGVSGSLQAAAAQAASGNGATVLTTLSFREVQLFLNVSAVSAAGGTLTVFVQSQDPVSGNWCDVGQFDQLGYDGANLTDNQESIPLGTPLQISLGTHPAAKALTGANIRVRWEVSGASFTFSVGYVGK